VGLVGEALKAEGIAVVWANDIDRTKAALFRANHDPQVLHEGDVHDVKGNDIPDVDIATASFPCTDVSLAGNRKGLAGEHSGTFWEFVRILRDMGDRRPSVVLLENVVGFFSSNGGEDLRAAFDALNGLGYRCDLVLMDAKWFVPQSRPRVFIVGSTESIAHEFLCDAEGSTVRPKWFRDFLRLHPELSTQTFALAPPEQDSKSLSHSVERLRANDSRWWDDKRVAAFISSLSEMNLSRLHTLKSGRKVEWRTAYRRTRNGNAVWEIREDAISGCLRTARGGSSKQAVVEAGRGRVRVRWMTAREYARLQGVPDFNIDSVTESQAMFGFGDAVCVPAVRYIVSKYLVPLLRGTVTERGSSDERDGEASEDKADSRHAAVSSYA
ncbi:MAG: DNA (cytosine-5-)-methyltransferase, partial [Coriobacteriia bacterium]|nr:DNA (cytosine-5-)-methyltransferase [Coriobacteriia bacterium]